jgi:hypothetical protein
MTEAQAFFEIANRQYKEFNEEARRVCSNVEWTYAQAVFEKSRITVTKREIKVVLIDAEGNEVWDTTLWDTTPKNK